MTEVELPTYTSIFAFERRLYAVYDWELPVPVSLFQLIAFAGALLVTIVVTGLLGVDPSAESAWVFVVPPGSAAYLASRPLADAKRPHAWLATQLRYLGEPRALNRLRPEHGMGVGLRFHTTVLGAGLGRSSHDVAGSS